MDVQMDDKLVIIWTSNEDFLLANEFYVKLNMIFDDIQMDIELTLQLNIQRDVSN